MAFTMKFEFVNMSDQSDLGRRRRQYAANAHRGRFTRRRSRLQKLNSGHAAGGPETETPFSAALRSCGELSAVHTASTLDEEDPASSTIDHRPAVTVYDEGSGGALVPTKLRYLPPALAAISSNAYDPSLVRMGYSQHRYTALDYC